MFRNYTDFVRTFQDDPQSSIIQQHSYEGYACDMCPADSVKYITETDVEIHRKRHHFREIIKVQHRERFCTVCMKLQPNYSTLISHLKTEHLYSSPTARRIEREIYICDYCNHIFFNKAILEIHIELKHLYDTAEKRRKRYYHCPKCQKKSSLLNVWFHFQQHDVPSVTVCDMCISTYPCREQLHEHLKCHPMLYRCDTCQYTTNKETLYNLHLDKHETRVVNEKRQINRSVKRVFQLTKKEVLLSFNIHNLLKGLKLPDVLGVCILCREMCTDKIDMKIHVLRDHLYKENTKKVRYICSCGEEFSNKILIKQHVFKLKVGHRILGQDEITESFLIRLKNKQIQEDTIQRQEDIIEIQEDIIQIQEDTIQIQEDTEQVNTKDKPMFFIEIDTHSAYDSNQEQISTDNHIIPTNNEAEATDVTITRLTDGQTENNLIINTDNLAKSGVIVITRVPKDATAKENNKMIMDSQIMTTDDQKMITDSQTTENQEMITDRQLMTTDTQEMISDSQMTADDQTMITGSQIMTTDTQTMITDSQTNTEDQNMITDS